MSRIEEIMKTLCKKPESLVEVGEQEKLLAELYQIKHSVMTDPNASYTVIMNTKNWEKNWYRAKKVSLGNIKSKF